MRIEHSEVEHVFVLRLLSLSPSRPTAVRDSVLSSSPDTSAVAIDRTKAPQPHQSRSSSEKATACSAPTTERILSSRAGGTDETEHGEDSNAVSVGTDPFLMELTHEVPLPFKSEGADGERTTGTERPDTPATRNSDAASSPSSVLAAVGREGSERSQGRTKFSPSSSLVRRAMERGARPVRRPHYLTASSRVSPLLKEASGSGDEERGHNSAFHACRSNSNGKRHVCAGETVEECAAVRRTSPATERQGQGKGGGEEEGEGSRAVGFRTEDDGVTHESATTTSASQRTFDTQGLTTQERATCGCPSGSSSMDGVKSRDAATVPHTATATGGITTAETAVCNSILCAPSVVETFSDFLSRLQLEHWSRSPSSGERPSVGDEGVTPASGSTVGLTEVDGTTVQPFSAVAQPSAVPAPAPPSAYLSLSPPAAGLGLRNKSPLRPLPPPPPPLMDSAVAHMPFGAGAMAAPQDVVAHARLPLRWTVSVSQQRYNQPAPKIFAEGSSLQTTSRVPSLLHDSGEEPKQLGNDDVAVTTTATTSARSAEPFAELETTLVSDHVDAVLPTWAFLSSHVAHMVQPLPMLSMARPSHLFGGTAATATTILDRNMPSPHDGGADYGSAAAAAATNSHTGPGLYALPPTPAATPQIGERVERQSSLYPHELAEAYARRRRQQAGSTAAARGPDSFHLLRVQLQCVVFPTPPTVCTITAGPRQEVLASALADFAQTGVLMSDALRRVLNDAALRIIVSVDNDVLRRVGAEDPRKEGDAQSRMGYVAADPWQGRRVVPLSLLVHSVQETPSSYPTARSVSQVNASAESSQTPLAPSACEESSARHYQPGCGFTIPTSLTLTVLLHVEGATDRDAATALATCPPTDDSCPCGGVDDAVAVEVTSAVLLHLLPLPFALSQWTTHLALSSALNDAALRTMAEVPPSDPVPSGMAQESASTPGRNYRAGEASGRPPQPLSPPPWTWQAVSVAAVRESCGGQWLPPPTATVSAIPAPLSPSTILRMDLGKVRREEADGARSGSSPLTSASLNMSRQCQLSTTPRAATITATSTDATVETTVTAEEDGASLSRRVTEAGDADGLEDGEEGEDNSFTKAGAHGDALLRWNVEKETSELKGLLKAIQRVVRALCANAALLQPILQTSMISIRSAGLCKGLDVNVDRYTNDGDDDDAKGTEDVSDAWQRCSTTTLIDRNGPVTSRAERPPDSRPRPHLRGSALAPSVGAALRQLADNTQKDPCNDTTHRHGVLSACQNVHKYALLQLIAHRLSLLPFVHGGSAPNKAAAAAAVRSGITQLEEATPSCNTGSLLAACLSSETVVAPVGELDASDCFPHWFAAYANFLVEHVRVPLEQLEVLILESANTAGGVSPLATASSIVENGSSDISSGTCSTRRVVPGAQVLSKPSRRRRRTTASSAAVVASEGLDGEAKSSVTAGRGAAGINAAVSSPDVGTTLSIRPALSIAKAVVQRCRAMANQETPLVKDEKLVARMLDAGSCIHPGSPMNSLAADAVLPSGAACLSPRCSHQHHRSFSNSSVASASLFGGVGGPPSLQECVFRMAERLRGVLWELEMEARRWAALRKPLTALHSQCEEAQEILRQEKGDWERIARAWRDLQQQWQRSLPAAKPSDECGVPVEGIDVAAGAAVLTSTPRKAHLPVTAAAVESTDSVHQPAAVAVNTVRPPVLELTHEVNGKSSNEAVRPRAITTPPLLVVDVEAVDRSESSLERCREVRGKGQMDSGASLASPPAVRPSMPPSDGTQSPGEEGRSSATLSPRQEPSGQWRSSGQGSRVSRSGHAAQPSQPSTAFLEKRPIPHQRSQRCSAAAPTSTVSMRPAGAVSEGGAAPGRRRKATQQRIRVASPGNATKDTPSLLGSRPCGRDVRRPRTASPTISRWAAPFIVVGALLLLLLLLL